jgi:hypothetical protein
MVAQSARVGSDGGIQSFSEWVGIGGADGNYDLVQIGTTTSPGSGPAVWWESLPSGEVPISLNVNTGDFVCGEVALAGYNLFDQQLWYLYIRDYTSGQYWDNWWALDVCGGAIFWPSCNSVNMNSAEWVLETPDLNGQQAQPPATTAVYFSSLLVERNGGWQDAGSIPSPGNFIMMNMVSGTNARYGWYGASARMAMCDGALSAVEISGMDSLSNKSTLVSAVSFPPETYETMPLLTSCDYLGMFGWLAMIQVFAVFKFRAFMRQRKSRKSSASVKCKPGASEGIGFGRSSRDLMLLRRFRRVRKPQAPSPNHMPKSQELWKVPVLVTVIYPIGGG